MARREHEAVAVGPVGSRRRVLHDARVEHVRERRERHRRAGMAGVGLLHRVHRERADRVDAELVERCSGPCGRKSKRQGLDDDSSGPSYPLRGQQERHQMATEQEITKTDERVARRAHPRAVRGAAQGRHRAAVHRQVLQRQGRRRLPLRGLRRRAVRAPTPSSTPAPAGRASPSPPSPPRSRRARTTRCSCAAPRSCAAAAAGTSATCSTTAPATRAACATASTPCALEFDAGDTAASTPNPK